jgi:hypothetical protein
MSIRYNVTGSERKALVGVVSELLNRPLNYRGAPTFAYTVGDCTIDREGALTFADDMSDEERNKLVTALKERGFGAAVNDTVDSVAIETPLTGFTPEKLDNLANLVESKAALIKKALGAEDLPVAKEDDRLRFPWFALSGIEGEIDAYTRFVRALCETAKKRKRVIAKEKPTENDKFAMRLFLVRLGLNGPENKAVRHIMLKNLTGNSAWKNGRPPATGDENPNKLAENTPGGENTRKA